MLFKKMSLKKSITLSVMILLLIALAVSATSLYYQQQSLASLEGLNLRTLSEAGLTTHINIVSANYQKTLFSLSILMVLFVLAGISLYLLVAQRVVRPLQTIASHFDKISDGDLTQPISVLTNNEVGAVFMSLRRMQESLARTVNTVRTGINEINANAGEMAEGNTNLTSRIGGQAAALQQTAASMEQLASTVRQNADNAHQANQLAVTASNVAQRGGIAVSEVVTTMESISASSNQIADIVNVIDSIAFQTNILALNAAVEAARAGELGRGFAVVAAEVRALAQRSAQAAREITALIDDSVAKVSEGSGQVERAGATMHEIVDSVKRVTDIMGEITAATIEQSTGIDEVNRAVNQMDQTTQYNAQLVDQAAKAAANLSIQVNQVTGAVSTFKLPSAELIERALQTRRLQGTQFKVDSAVATPKKSLKLEAASASSATNKRNALDKSTVVPAIAVSSSYKTTDGSAAVSKLEKVAQQQQKSVSSTATSDMTLLRPDLSNTKTTSSDDDWEEF